MAAVVEVGADAVGFVFAPRSPRRLAAEQASELAAAVPAFVSRVGLFQDQDAEEVARILDQVPLNLLQFHGSEPADYCGQFGMPYIKAVSMVDSSAVEHAELNHPDAAALLLDSHAPGQPGGTGRAFDWSDIGSSHRPIVIAGGLNPANVFEAVRNHRPWGVDVSSGVESAPGHKDQALVMTFVEEVERADREDR